MLRRALLVGGGTTLAGVAGLSVPITAAIQDETDGEQSESESIEFDGEGVTVTDEFEIGDGPMIVEGTHDGESDFFVRAVPREDGQDYSVINSFGEFDGTTGAFMQEGTYVMYVDADGPWELTVRQPHASEDEAADPSGSVTGAGSDWIGPIRFDESTRIGGRYDGEGTFHVRVIPQDETDSEYVWDGGELVFHALGPFSGITSTYVDGIGYLDVEAADDQTQWTLELE